MSLATFLVHNRIARPLIAWGERLRAPGMVAPIRSSLSKKAKILEIGAGSCEIVDLLQREGYNVTPLDVYNYSTVDHIASMVYDGRVMPFGDQSYDIAMILTVLHHTPDPIAIIKEAKRVAKTIIITEDVYRHKLGKYLTFFFDSLFNAEFIGHPHSNKNDAEWRAVFAQLGLKVVATSQRRAAFVFFQRTYVLE